MTNEFYTGYQYDRCSSRGICSINPATSALQEIVFLYLKNASLCGIKLKEQSNDDNVIKSFILNTISVLSSNYELSETNFLMISAVFKNEISKIIGEVDNKNLSDVKDLINLEGDINNYIRYGEREFTERIQSITTETRSLYQIIFSLVKSLCINILTFESIKKENLYNMSFVYKIFSSFNAPIKTKGKLKNLILKIATIDCELIKNTRKLQEEKYGIQEETELSFSTEKGKAVLVAGSNICELETILENFKSQNINIYTHDNMILAHTFPKFKEYKNLKGQFGQGMENCLLDFSTFPGPIILTKNSLFNVESLYRGRLFTTDIAHSKGVIQIKNNDFSEVIKSAEESKGFKSGKTCQDETIGFNYIKSSEEIGTVLASDKYKRILIIGLDGYTIEEKIYFQTLLNHTSKDTFIISLSCCDKKENMICLNSPADICSMLKVSEQILKNTNKKIPVFIPHIDRHMLSVILYLSTFENAKLFIGDWAQSFANSSINKSLVNEFGINKIISPKKDLDFISSLK